MTPTVDPLLRVMHEAGAAVLLVDLATSEVVYANRRALAMAGQQELPLSVDRWSQLAGLTDVQGGDLADSAGPLSRVARGQPVAGEMVRRRSVAAVGADDAIVMRASGATGDAEGALEGPLWVTGFPLDPADAALGAGLHGHALLVFLALTGSPATPRSLAGGEVPAQGPLDPRAVIATDLSFTISDPRLPDNPLVWVNPAFTRTTGYESADVVGLNCRFLQGPGTDPAPVVAMREAMAAGEGVTVTLLNYRKDGTAFWNQVSISPVLDAEGNLINFVGVQVDVTERVEVEAERERARARVDFLATVSAAVTALDGRVALSRFAELFVPEFADGVLVCDVGTELDVVAVAGSVPEDALGRHRRIPPLTDADRERGDPLVAVLRGEGRDGLGFDVDAARGRPGTLTAWLARLLPPGERALVMPLTGRQSVVGLMVLVGVGGDVDDLRMLHEAAARGGLALENARLFAREHALAETLQRSMLPPPVALADLDVWAHYAPNVDLAQVGGDWYDVMTRPDGSHGIVIGDVVGHDVEAAAVMGQLRSISRAYGYEVHDPAQVLDRVDQLAFSMQLPRLASAVFVTLRRDGVGWRLDWANAGHLPPLLRRDGGVEALRAAGGTLLGLLGGDRRSQTLRLRPDDVLVLYSDGLVERRTRPMREGLDLLREAVLAAPGKGAEALGRALLEAVGQGPEDDIAVLVLRIPTDTDDAARPLGVVRRELDRSGHAPRQARAFTTEWLHSVPGAPRASALLVVSELVTNAVRHGHGPIGLELSTVSGRVRIQVEDDSRKVPQIVDARPEGGGRGLHIVDQLAQWGWEPTSRGKVVWALLTPPPAADS